MANPFLNKTALVDRDTATALLLEKAVVHDIGKAVAYTDGDKTYINTEDNLNEILPAYDQRMLKWLLWHEKMHIELRHHNRFFKYLQELDAKTTKEKFQVTKEEVNIIMDILVHDSLSKMFPELIEIAVENFAQMRNRNSLGYTFKTNTLEKMLDEYKAHKKDEGKDSKDTDDTKDIDDTKDTDDTKDAKDTDDTKDTPAAPAKSKDVDEPDDTEDTPPDDTAKSPARNKVEQEDEHDKTDWSKLDDIDTREFISEEEAESISKAVERLKRKKIRLGQLTETLNSLVTSTRKRSYKMPSTIYAGSGVLLKGSTPGRTQLYLVFDASGSMGHEMALFKEIISNSIPQAMKTPTEWFAGMGSKIKPYKEVHCDGYYKGTFEDFMNVSAYDGFADDGDRTIELCWQAEQAGFSPIGITDGGYRLSWGKDKLKELKRTVFVGPDDEDTIEWFDKVKAINPRIQTLIV